MTAGAGSTSAVRFFLLWQLVLAVVVVSCTAATLHHLPAAAAAAAEEQPPGQVVTTYSISTVNVLNPTYDAFMRRRLLPWAQQNLERVSNYIRNRILCRQTKTHDEVILRFEDALPAPNNRAYVTGNTIWVSLEFVAASPLFHSDDERATYFERTVYHEMTHVWQFLTGYTTMQDETRGLVEGMADYAAAKGHGADFLTCQPTFGDKWYQGYCHTAKFLMYAEDAGYGGGVVCNANIMMRNGYDDETFRAILNGTPPEVVWRNYLNSLVNPPSVATVSRRPPPNKLASNNRTDDVVAATATH